MKKFISILTALAIAFGIFTPFRLYFEGGQALAILIPTVLIVIYDALFSYRSFWPVAAYVGVSFVIMVTGSKYFTIPGLIQIVFAYACFEHFIKTRDYEFAKIVIFTTYAALLLMVFTSIPLFISMPNLSRLMIDAEENGITQPILYWTISYPTIHALPVYSIPLYYLLRFFENRFVRLFLMISILAIFTVMLFADSTGALIVNIIIFAIMLVYNKNRSLRANIGRLAVLGLAMLAFLDKKMMISFLSMVQPLFIGSSTYKKIDEMKWMFMGQNAGGDIGAREEKINISLDSFFANPLFPEYNMEKIGQHNFLFDQIVAMGLIPGIFFIWFLVDRIKRPIKYLSNVIKPYYLLGIFAMLVMGGFKNFFLLLPACVILPMLMIVTERN